MLRRFLGKTIILTFACRTKEICLADITRNEREVGYPIICTDNNVILFTDLLLLKFMRLSTTSRSSPYWTNILLIFTVSKKHVSIASTPTPLTSPVNLCTFSTVFTYSVSTYNKEVRLRCRKRDTARCVASTHTLVLSWGTPHPDLAQG